MNYNDRIYGNTDIIEPVILDLINCQTLQRLKNIDQAGYFEPHFPGTSYSRFEHSVGVYLLLKNYNASIEEQIAGLIHDVSHSAFSHCIDYVLDVGSQKKHNHQDNIFDEFVRKSEIPGILKKYNFDINYILDDNNFPLKEKNLPDLCADRIDYSLRSAILFGEMKQIEIQNILNNLIVENNDWIFKNFETAQIYSKLFLKINTKYYSGLPSAVMFTTVGNYLRYALLQKYISESDLYTDDKTVLFKIEPYLKNDEKLQLLFDRMNNKIGFKNNPDDYDGEVFCKSRVIDPYCYYNNRTQRVSDIDINWKDVLQKESESKHYFIKFDK